VTRRRHPAPPPFEPLPSPDPAAVARAFAVINEFKLAAYQQLYAHQLTDPQGRPFQVDFDVAHGSLRPGLRIIPAAHPEQAFTVHTPDEALAKARLMGGANAPTRRPHACCALAQVHPCVCMYAYDCPVHGTMHIGTHD
jgi:hypothetical protein